MRKIFVMAVFACFTAMNVNAQTAETESKNEEMLRLTKAADENPTDWKAQFDDESGRREPHGLEGPI